MDDLVEELLVADHVHQPIRAQQQHVSGRELLPEQVISVTIEKNPEKGFDYRKITVEGLE